MLTFHFQLDFPAITVCNQNRVHCGRLKTLMTEHLAKANHLNVTEVEALATILEDTGCRTNTVLPGGFSGSATWQL